MASTVLGKGDTDAVGAKRPVERLRGWGEIREKSGGSGEGGEFGEGNRGEAMIVECSERYV